MKPLMKWHNAQVTDMFFQRGMARALVARFEEHALRNETRSKTDRIGITDTQSLTHGAQQQSIEVAEIDKCAIPFELESLDQ